MYCLRVFIEFTTMFNVIILLCSLKNTCITCFVSIGCCASELRGPPYHNVLPEAVYCYFTTIILFTTMFTVVFVVCSLKSIYM